jgi:hypothetical protein
VQVLQEEKLMPVEGYEHLSITEHARQRLRDLRSLLMELGMPAGVKISAPDGWTVSAVVEIAVATTERELKKKGKR